MATKKSSRYRPKLEIYTDGSCRPNPGKGGAASIIVKNDKIISKRYYHKKQTTNQEMELVGMMLGLNNLRTYVQDNPEIYGYRVQIFTDSRYVRDGIMFWMKDWKKNGWRNGKDVEVKNLNMWKSIDELLTMLDNFKIRLRFHWIKGHNGNKYNEIVDKEAAYAGNL